ncbi:MAG TPA: hypothetical protein VMV11_03945, partial [Acidimicrobiales bacterium]|nr:hypothetical protein [Acidimicrobiales bacterium]
MSVISFPRRVDTRRPPTRQTPSTRPASRRAEAPRRDVAAKHWRSTSSSRKSATIVVLALILSLAGSMFEANRQIEIHTLQGQLLQEQST